MPAAYFCFWLDYSRLNDYIIEWKNINKEVENTVKSYSSSELQLFMRTGQRKWWVLLDNSIFGKYAIK